MPRAFLITHRRYNGAEEFEEVGRDYSPERGVRLADYNVNHPTSDGASECGSETSSECPEELYNLTKLAEVSLAAAAGTLIHPHSVTYGRSSPSRSPRSPKSNHPPEKCSRSLSSRTKQQHEDEVQFQTHQISFHEERSREERTRLFFERIDDEREVLESRAESNVLEIRVPSPPHHVPRDPHSRVPTDALVAEPRLESPSMSNSSSAVVQGRRTASASTDTPRAEDNEDHECPDCGKKYSTSSNLARHRQTHRSLGDKKARRCPHCDKVYVSMPAFSMHVRTHNQGCKCHYCGKCFSRPWLLQGHIRTHTGEKPFKCTICNKAFADKSNLRAHIQTHSNTKPHVCGRCGKAFALKSYLYKHEESSCMRAHHRSSTDKSEQADQKIGLPFCKTNGNPLTPLNRLQSTSCVTASPTSVIVPRVDLNRDPKTSSSAFSAIIRHTRTPETNSINSALSLKRSCSEKTPYEEERNRQSPEFLLKDAAYSSRMVIRTSVISSNPEHVDRFGNEVKESHSTIDFRDSARSSAFARPATMTLNLAIA